MNDRPALRALAAVALAAMGVAAAMALGAPLAGALIALLAGALAFATAPTGSDALPPLSETGSGTAADVLPTMAELLRSVDEPMLIVRSGRVIAVNAPAKALLGDHIEGVDVRLAIRHPAAAEQLTGSAGESETAPSRAELIGLGEPDRQWSMSATLLPDGSRIVRLSDQSAARALEQMRADFVANASHELRTPLAAILGFLETLQDEEAAADPDTRSRFLKIMSDEAVRMRELVNDLMSLSAIEADRFTAPRDPVDLVPLTHSVAAGLEALADSRGSEIVVENEARMTVVPGDRAQLAQLLNNLLTNALKYGRPGTPVRVRLEEAAAGMLRLRVIDQGEGIAPEHIPRLTERFYRVNASRSRSEGGTGLGLAIAKHIALRHRGRLEIVSKVGEGTSVRVYLPQATEDAAQPA